MNVNKWLEMDEDDNFQQHEKIVSKKKKQAIETTKNCFDKKSKLNIRKQRLAKLENQE